MLKSTRIEDRSKLQKPFEQVDPEEVLVMICKWLSNHKGRMIKPQLRIQNQSCSIMHYIGLRVYTRHIYVSYVHDLPSGPSQVTHVWKPTTIFTNLTANEIKESVTRAQRINYLAVQKQTNNDLPDLDALLESWLNEDEDSELPQLKSNDLSEKLARTDGME